MDCSNCGQTAIAGYRDCLRCGYRLSDGGANGGGANDSSAAFRSGCGLPLDDPRRGTLSQEIVEDVPAGFLIRLAAWLIDWIALLVAEFAVVAALPGLSLTRYGDGTGFTWTFNEISFLLAIVYYTLAVSLFSTTIGKRLLGLYVLRRDGSKISFARALCRSLAYIPSYLLLGIGFLMVGFTRSNRGLHDFICDTVVIKR